MRPVEVLAAELKRVVRPHFNLIHNQTGFKADIYPCRDWLQRWGMERRSYVEWEGLSVAVAPPEYVILMKLEYFFEGGSEKHLTDIQRMLVLTEDKLDQDWLIKQIANRGLEPAWARIPKPKA